MDFLLDIGALQKVRIKYDSVATIADYFNQEHKLYIFTLQYTVFHIHVFCYRDFALHVCMSGVRTAFFDIFCRAKTIAMPADFAKKQDRVSIPVNN